MNWICTILEIIYCLHSFCAVFAVHSKHFKNNNNNKNQNNNNYQNFDNYLFSEIKGEISSTELVDYKHRIAEHDLWNHYESYQPSIEESIAMARYDVSTERPPYYLSYDSGVKTRFQAMEEKLIQQQMADQNRKDDQDYEPNTRIKQNRFDSPSKKLSQDKYQYQIKSQIKEQDQDEQEINEKLDQNNSHKPNIKSHISKEEQKEQNRKVGQKGLGGTFGFMMGQHFFPCDKPEILDHDTETGNYFIPKRIGYYYKCQYFDNDPRRQFQRKVGRLGLDGYYGYFEGGRFIECAPPKRIEPDTQDPNVYYIPNNIDYEPKCQYYGYNVSKRFDASSDYRISFGHISVKTIDNLYYSVILLPFYVLILILSYF